MSSSSTEQEHISSENSAYLDPPNADAIIDALKNAEMHDDILRIINNTFDTWLKGFPKRFSEDYPHFQNNWEYVCKKSNCTPLNIAIVDFMVFNNPKYRLIQTFAELLTVMGYSVRRKEEFIGCKVCGNAIPTQPIYGQLRDRKIPVPMYWMTKCVNC